MFSSINRVVKAKARALKLFHKLVKKLEKQANKLANLELKSMEKMAYYESAQKEIKHLSKDNQKTLSKIKEFIE